MIGSTGVHAANPEVITIDVICQNCGASNPSDARFCKNCRKKLAWKLSEDPSQSTPAPPDPAAPVLPNQGYADPGDGDEGNYALVDNVSASDEGGAPESGSSAPTVELPAATDLSCPECQTINPGTRRFCAHCGYAFFDRDAAGSHARYANLSAASQAARDRAARKAYRRSLPLFYRSRRVIITMLVVALLVVAAVVLRRDPVGMVKGAWYSLRQEYVWVKPIEATALPPKATAAKSDPAYLVDESENAWTMNWAPTGESTCGPAPSTGSMLLTFAPTRIRMIQIAPGLAESNPQRKLQPLPKVMGISFDNGPCQTIDLTAKPEQQSFKIDSEKPVTQARIDISSAYPAPNTQPLISVTEVILKAYPTT
jgi:ribosomal protein L40E